MVGYEAFTVMVSVEVALLGKLHGIHGYRSVQAHVFKVEYRVFGIGNDAIDLEFLVVAGSRYH